MLFIILHWSHLYFYLLWVANILLSATTQNPCSMYHSIISIPMLPSFFHYQKCKHFPIFLLVKIIYARLQLWWLNKVVQLFKLPLWIFQLKEINMGSIILLAHYAVALLQCSLCSPFQQFVSTGHCGDCRQMLIWRTMGTICKV